MGSEWRKTTILECASSDPYSTQIGPFGNKIKSEIYTVKGAPVLRGVNVNSDSRFHDADFVFIDQKLADQEFTKFTCEAGDVILCHKGTLGKIGIIPFNSTYSKYIMGNSMMKVRTDPKKMYSLFLFYWLTSDYGQEYIFSRVSQVGVPQIQSPLSTLRAAEIFLPPLSEQKAIVDILGSLDDKIELNQKMNQTFEAMAQALFKSWFVDFDPVIDNALVAGNPIPDEFAERAEIRRQALANGTANREVAKDFPAGFRLTEEMGWVPEGWEVRKAESIINRKKVNQKYTKNNVLISGDVPVFDQGAGLLLGFHNGMADINSSKLSPSFIFGDHTCTTHLSTRSFSVGPNVIPLEAKTFDPYWTYFAIKDIQVFEEYRRHWMEFKIKNILIPPKDLASLFGQLVREIYFSIESNSDQSASLTLLRDTLLPILISGDIVLPNAIYVARDNV